MSYELMPDEEGELEFWIQALEMLEPENVTLLIELSLKDGFPIRDFIYEAIKEKAERELL
jgi:hypothetical protein